MFVQEGAHYLAVLKNGFIEGFEPVALEDANALLGPFPTPVTEIGSPDLISFVTTSGNCEIGDANQIKTYLRANLESYATRPFLFFDIADFLGDSRVRRRARSLLSNAKRFVDPASDLDNWSFEYQCRPGDPAGHQYSSIELDWGGRPLTLETGKIARQADGAVLATYGETTVLAAVVAAKQPKEGIDFLRSPSITPRNITRLAAIPGGLFQARARPDQKRTR